MKKEVTEKLQSELVKIVKKLVEALLQLGIEKESATKELHQQEEHKFVEAQQLQ